jgi:membrane protein DedA with SNARE-associated domain
MPDAIDALTGSAAGYALVIGFVALDAVLPIAPSETLLAAGGVLVADGDLSFPLLVLAGALGAIAGHSFLFVVGRRLGPAAEARFVRGPRARRGFERTSDLLAQRTWLLIVADFLPAGRTVAMFAAGATGLPAPRFFAFVLPGALLWSSFYALLGFTGGSVFESRWPALAASVGAALVVAGGSEAVIRLRGRHE